MKSSDTKTFTPEFLRVMRTRRRSRGSELKLNDNGADLNSNWKRTSDRPTDQRWERNATSIPHYRIDAAVRILMRRERGEEEGGEMKWRIPERKGGTEEKEILSVQQMGCRSHFIILMGSLVSLDCLYLQICRMNLTES